MVTDFGMSDKMGPRTFGNKQEMVFLGREISEQRDYSERTALEIDREIDTLIDEAYATAKKVLVDNKEKLVELAKKLIEKETLEGEELESILKTLSIPAPKRRIKKTDIPAPIQPAPEGELLPQPKKAPTVPQLVPKQTPAPSD
jgi:cell division protease FtsH